MTVTALARALDIHQSTASNLGLLPQTLVALDARTLARLDRDLGTLIASWRRTGARPACRSVIREDSPECIARRRRLILARLPPSPFSVLRTIVGFSRHG